MILNPDIEAAVWDHIDLLNETEQAYCAANYPGLDPHVFSMGDSARSYTRIIRERPGVSYSGSVHAFVVNATGELLKPAGWAGPVRNLRGYDLRDDRELLERIAREFPKQIVFGGYLYQDRIKKFRSL